MSVDCLVPASDPASVSGYIIMEVMGYPIYSGSNTICTATAVLETGLVAKTEGAHRFQLEAPAGPVAIEARVQGDVVESITCSGLPAYIDSHRQTIDVPGLGPVGYSIVYSGGFYAMVDAAGLGFELRLAEERALADRGYRLVEAIRAQRRFIHPLLGDVGPLPFVHFMGPLEQDASGQVRSRSATYVHPGVVCRSTTGTGTSARLALLQREQSWRSGDALTTVSLRGSTFTGRISGIETVGDRLCVANTITGKAYPLARSTIHIDFDDPLVRASGIDPALFA